jgi:hypothetical protein
VAYKHVHDVFIIRNREEFGEAIAVLCVNMFMRVAAQWSLALSLRQWWQSSCWMEFLSKIDQTCSASTGSAQLLSKILSLDSNIQVWCCVRPLQVNGIKTGAKNNMEMFPETELGCFDNRQFKYV